MKRILVVGGTRYIGKGIVKKHIENGDSVELVTRGITPDSFGSAVKHTHLDLMSSDDVRQFFPSGDYDIVYDDLVLCPDHIKERLDRLSCGKYVMISTDEVYRDHHYDIKEEEFDAEKESWEYCGYKGWAYDFRKRQAEAALAQDYPTVKNIRVRIPVALGEDDYTHRLDWFVDHVLEGIPIRSDDYNVQMPFSYVKDISEMIFRSANSDYEGAINGSLNDVSTIAELIKYIEKITGKVGIFSIAGEEAPIKVEKAYSLNTDKARELGIRFEDKDIIFDLIERLYFKRKQS